MILSSLSSRRCWFSRSLLWFCERMSAVCCVKLLSLLAPVFPSSSGENRLGLPVSKLESTCLKALSRLKGEEDEFPRSSNCLNSSLSFSVTISCTSDCSIMGIRSAD